MRRKLKISSMRNLNSSAIHTIHEASNHSRYLSCSAPICGAFSVGLYPIWGIEFCDQMLLQKKITLTPRAVWSVSLIRASVHLKLFLLALDSIWRARSF